MKAIPFNKQLLDQEGCHLKSEAPWSPSCESYYALKVRSLRQFRPFALQWVTFARRH
jgi:hypothetical protein